MQNLLELNKKFKYTRLITIISLVGLITISLLSVIYVNKMEKDFSKRIYVVNKDKQFEAMVSDINHNRQAEIKYHITRFHELFFTISPDPKAIDENAQRFLYLGDESVMRNYMDLKERGYYSAMISGNVNQKITVDSIYVDMNSYPYYVRAFFSLNETRASSSRHRIGTSECFLEDVPRTTNSPNGLLMRKYKVLRVIESKKKAADIEQEANE